MSKIGYIIKCAVKTNKKEIFIAVKKISKRSNKPFLISLLDIVWCGFRYGAGLTDYDLFVMERANCKQRKTFITRGKNNSFVKLLNNKDFWHFFSNKDEFNKAFEEYIGRRWMRINSKSSEDFKQWIIGIDTVIAKPRAEMCGKGIKKLYVHDFNSIDEMFSYLISINCELVEECVVQHIEMNRIYPYSVNTVRIITIAKNGKTIIIVAYLRIGNGSHVDNFNSGGMITKVDLATGKVMFDAFDQIGHIYSSHPVTAIKFVGFQIPFWAETINLVERAAQVIPEIGYVGWDVAITPKGPVLIEGNEFPGSMHQLPLHTPDNFGLLPLFEKAIFG